jgi:hypothetical protein
MAACAEFRNRTFDKILFSGDNPAKAEKHEKRNWGSTSIEKVFQLSLNAIILTKD